jgi:hypothetical protein
MSDYTGLKCSTVFTFVVVSCKKMFDLGFVGMFMIYIYVDME